MRLVDRVPLHVRNLVPYPPGKPIEEVEREYGVSSSVKLASNECPIGPSPMAVEAVRGVLGRLNIYPDGSGYYLKGKLAEKLGVERENIILGNGSNEIIEFIARAFVAAGDEAVMGAPAFIVYQMITDAVGGKKVVVPLSEFNHDLAAMAEAVTDRTRVIFVANPNNPTGRALGRADLETFLASVPEEVLVVMDEAYYEYAEGDDRFQSASPYLDRYRNLIVLRTFSKAYGLAALRVGYGISSPEVISVLEKVRMPFNVNAPALAGAEAALEDAGHLERGLQVNREGLASLCKELEKAGLDAVESLANFILFDAGMDGSELYERLLKRGVIVRPMGGYGLKNHIRVTVGTKEENGKFISALRESLD